MIIEINDAKDKLRYQTIRPLCYRILPSYMWAQNVVIEENYRLFIPEDLEKEKFTVSMKIIDAGTEDVVPILLKNNRGQPISLETLVILKK